MASVVGTRRSPRFIEHLCNNTTIPSLNNEQTATLLALAHCTGWSADQIANKFAEATGFVISPEDIWDHHWSWVFGRNEGEEISTAEWDIMQVLMRKVGGVELEKPERALSQTAKPKTIIFAAQWSAKDPASRPLFAGFTGFTRDVSKGYLLIQKSSDVYGLLTPTEERVLGKFGENVLYIFRKLLKHWARAMLDKVHEDSGLRPIKEREHVGLIMEYLQKFQNSYEERFGKMETGKSPSAFGEIKDNTVFIKSTGYGVKVVLGLLMADRMHVIQKKRKLEREIIGFMEVEVENLEHDSKDCPICQDPMGVESPDGAKETPLRLVICCGQVIGSHCLKTWLTVMVFDNHRDSCPICRFKFPLSFLENLFTPEEYRARIAREREELDLTSPTPDPAVPMRSQQEQDALLLGQLGGDGEGEMMDVDSVMELLRSPSVGIRGVRRPMAVEISSRSVEHADLAADEVMDDNFEVEG